MTTDRRGIRFPLAGTSRSSTATAPQIIADSLSSVAPQMADDVRRVADWRRRYVEAFSASTALAANSKSSISVAEEGLRSARDRFVFVQEGAPDAPLLEWLEMPASVTTDGYGSEVIRGTGQVGMGSKGIELTVPYAGRHLAGDALRAQLRDWTSRGVIEPGFADAVHLVIDNPEWLSLPGHTAILLGAGAAMGPLELLSSWGADIVAVDVPVPAVQERIARIASRGTGTVTVPRASASAIAGLDLPGDLPSARGWLRGVVDQAHSPILSANTYADGAAHVEVNLACDVIGTDLTCARPDAMLVFLNTPTDSFLVPLDAVAHARAKANSWRWNGPHHRVIGKLSGERLFQLDYRDTLEDELGHQWGLSDTLVPVQGPNYALAKRVQRWRAVLEHDAGRRVSSTVAPASWTHSVTKNRVLKAVYAGAAAFGIEIFQPDTARTLMAAKLVADTFRPLPSRDTHPEGVFVDAAHGGLWRQPFHPRSALGAAAVLGAPASALRRA